MDTLVQRIQAAASQDRSVTFVVGGSEEVVSWAEMAERAKVVAAELQRRGVKPGDKVALLAVTSKELLVAMQAIWLAGATIVILPLPVRMGALSEFIAATQHRIQLAESALVLVSGQFAMFTSASTAGPPAFALEELVQQADSTAAFVPADYAPDDIAILQFTSGSTAAPKGVVLPNRSILANLDAMADVVGVDLGVDVLVSWLPLYHDMGLVGCCVLPMSLGMNLVLGSPQDFRSSPATWMEWVSTYRGTLTAGPNFSYVLAARGLRRDVDLDLSSLRIALNGSEPVDPVCVRNFVAAGQRHGLRSGAAFPAFGMAEVAIAGSFPEPLSGLQLDVVDAARLEIDGKAVPVEPDDPGGREMVKLGVAVPGLKFAIVDPESGAKLADRSVGELRISGSSLASGYYNNPEATAEHFEGGWLKTGDLAYLVDGQLVICGRSKDIIIVGGKNIYPQDIERVVGQVERVRAGNVAAFAQRSEAKGKEGIVVVAETREPPTDETLVAVRSAVVDAVGVPTQDVVFVRSGSLPKTSSGKLQRRRTAKSYRAEELQVVEVA